jgi:hypothetical protein
MAAACVKYASTRRLPPHLAQAKTSKRAASRVALGRDEVERGVDFCSAGGQILLWQMAIGGYEERP